MYNGYYERLNEGDKKDYRCIVKKCQNIFINYNAYDVLTFINNYLYNLSDTVNCNYFLAICKLEDYYMSIYKKEKNSSR